MTKRERERIENAAKRLTRALHAAKVRSANWVAEVESEGEASEFLAIAVASTPRKYFAIHLADQASALMGSALK